MTWLLTILVLVGYLLGAGAEPQPAPEPLREVVRQAPGREPVEGRPNILLITIETLRRDHCSLYGYERDTTPFLEELAAGSVVFDDAYSMAGYTKPSMASITTGRFPAEHGCHKHWSALVDNLPTLPKLLKDAGYHTAAFWTNAAIAKQCYGFGRGFDRFWFEGNGTRCAVLRKHSVSWVRSAGEPWFVWLHVWDPHMPYEPPEAYDRYDPDTYRPLRVPHHQARYDGEIAYTDAQLGKLRDDLNRLGLWDDALVVISADHGETLLDMPDRGVGHGPVIWPERVSVPLLIKMPENQYAGIRVTGKAWGIDLMPTILAAVGVPAPDGLPGEDLLPYVRDGRPLRDYYVSSAYSFRSGWTQTVCLTADVMYEVRTGLEEVEHLRSLDEPWAGPDLLVPGRILHAEGDVASHLRECQERLRPWADRLRIETMAPDAHPDPETLQALRDLGYL